jgi:phospholipid/cholesterol/gamma-HCH transport system permease protein
MGATMVREEDRLSFVRPREDTLVVRVSGDWKLGLHTPAVSEIEFEIDKGPAIREVALEGPDLGNWDSSLLTFLIKVIELCARKDKKLSRNGLPQGVQRLLELATAVPERKGPSGETRRASFLDRTGNACVEFLQSSLDILTFIGDASFAFVKMAGGKARFRRSDLVLAIQQCGADALPIVSLISVLVGLILAFVGSIQLQMFGAQIYIADLVGIAMTRAMGAIMTGIIMAGRTGSSFAARIGTMQVNEEIDALRTAGISPMEFLVLPRILALAIMMPLLTLYSDLMGILGGLIVSVGGFNISFREYFNETRTAVGLTNVWIGLFSSLVFGVLIALAGCLRGMQCGRSASAVGDATTSAVVTGIVSIIVATAIITVLCNMLKI